jgi:mRNA interferase HigB
MIITGSEILEEFCKKHSDALNAIAKWVSDVSLAEWKNHNELKNSYTSADYVGNSRYVFNIRGNNYRLVVVVVFFAGTVNIRFAGTHAEYDKIDVKNI